MDGLSLLSVGIVFEIFLLLADCFNFITIGVLHSFRVFILTRSLPFPRCHWFSIGCSIDESPADHPIRSFSVNHFLCRLMARTVSACRTRLAVSLHMIWSSCDQRDTEHFLFFLYLVTQCRQAQVVPAGRPIQSRSRIIRRDLWKSPRRLLDGICPK